MFDNVSLWGTDLLNTTITGVHTPPASGELSLNYLILTSPTHIFSSVAAGTTTLELNQCDVRVTNGYCFNLLNWTGILYIFSSTSVLGTNDGFLNNTGGSHVFAINADVGIGSVNAAVMTGTIAELVSSSLNCPATIAGAGSLLLTEGCEVTSTLTTGGSATLIAQNTAFQPIAGAAIAHGSSGTAVLTNCSINSSNNPSITGSGAGILTLGGVDFLNNTLTAGTLTLGTVDMFKAGAFQWLSTGTATGNSPQIVNARSGRVTFQTVSIAAAADQSFVLTNSAITAASTIVMYSMSGATTGSALSIKSITNTGGSSTIVVTNGTGATTSTANIIFDFVIIN